MFIDNFRRLCEQKGISETAVTRQLGIGGGTYANWVNSGKPQNPNKKKLADYFGITVDELMSGEMNVQNEYCDEELKEILQTCKERPEFRMMFQTFKNVKSSDILKVMADYKEMRGE